MPLPVLSVRAMPDLGGLGRLLVLVGLAFVVLGGLLWGLHTLLPGLHLGRLPGDIRIHRDGFTFYLPLTTMILLSLVLSAVLWLIHRLGH